MSIHVMALNYFYRTKAYFYLPDQTHVEPFNPIFTLFYLKWSHNK